MAMVIFSMYRRVRAGTNQPKNRLLLDDRHKYLQILEFSEIDKRRFTRWSMRSIILERWMTTDPKVKALMPFKPYSWSNEQGRQFLDFYKAITKNKKYGKGSY